jgi:hypothetical protein
VSDAADVNGERAIPSPCICRLLAGIEATLRVLDGEEVKAPNNRPPEPVLSGSVMAMADPDGEHVRLDIDVSATHASLRLDPLLALRFGGEVLAAVGLVMRPTLTGLRRATRYSRN